MIESLRSTAATGGTATSDAVKAPLFASLVERLDQGERWVVLDLGPARSTTLDLLSRFSCRLLIANVDSDLAQINALEGTAAEIRPAMECFLPPAESEPVDLVLCWDLLNYLRPEAFEALMRCVAARGRPGTMAHALIAYSSPRMAATPGHWALQGGDHLAYRPLTTEQQPAPRYSPEDIRNRMPDFRVDRGVLLRNGMQEFLLQLGVDG